MYRMCVSSSDPPRCSNAVHIKHDNKPKVKSKHHRKDGGKRITNNIYYRRRYLHFTFGLLSCLMTPHSSIEADPMTIHTFCTWPVFVPGTYLTYVPSVQAEGVLRRAIVPNYYVREHVRTYVRERLLSFFCLEPDVGAKNSSSRLPIGQSSRNESRLIANQQQLPDLQLGVASMNIFAQDDAYLGGAVCTNKSW